MAKMRSGPAVEAPSESGVTEALRAKMRAIYDDPVAYAEWRVRMGLSKPIEPRGNPVMRARIARLFRELVADMEALPAKKSAPEWRRPEARKLTPEELAAKWKDDPPIVGDALRTQNASAQAQVMGKYVDVDGRD